MTHRSLTRRRFLYLSAGAALVASCTNNNTPATPRLDPTSATWAQVVDRARGPTVNWAMWGGSEQTNAYVDGWVASE